MQFGPFEILRPLGRGGMAETFLAVRRGHEGFQREVCLKRVLPERAAEPGFVRLFQREARFAARLSHPHIAQVFEFGCDEDAWWMSLEYVPGGDLRSLLKQLGQPLPVDLTLVLALDVLEALACAHDHIIDGQPAGLVHRDVSPSNILLDLQGNFKLADFGIAKPTHRDRIKGETGFTTTTGTVKGKAAYMAPEQALGKTVDGRADLWSVGVILYEALSGARPFDGPSDLAIMMAASLGQREPLSKVAPHVPADLCVIVEKFLAPNPDNRYANAGDAIDALGNRPSPINGRRRLAEMTTALRRHAAEAPITAPEPDPGATRTIYDPAQLASMLPETAARPSATAKPRDTPSPAIEAKPIATVTAQTSPVTRQPRRWLPTVVMLVGVASVAAVGWAFATRETAAPPGPMTATSLTPTVVVPTTVAATATPTAPFVPDTLVRGILAPAAEEPDASVPEVASTPTRTPRRGGREERPTPTPAATAPATAAPTPPAAAAIGSLRVTAFPWGDVSVDGARVGRCPVMVNLPVGTHRVVISAGTDSVTRTVRITEGNREEIDIDFEAPTP